MTSRNDQRIHPIGYCAGKDADPRGWSFIWIGDPVERERQRAREVQRFDRFAAKYHSDGHANEEEASDCYREYRLDQLIRTGSTSDARTCQGTVWPDGTEAMYVGDCSEVAPALTRELVLEGDFRVWHLCKAHQRRDVYERLLGAKGRVYTSVHS